MIRLEVISKFCYAGVFKAHLERGFYNGRFFFNFNTTLATLLYFYFRKMFYPKDLNIKVRDTDVGLAIVSSKSDQPSANNNTETSTHNTKIKLKLLSLIVVENYISELK